jgi:hypothetical protein
VHFTVGHHLGRVGPWRLKPAPRDILSRKTNCVPAIDKSVCIRHGRQM